MAKTRTQIFWLLAAVCPICDSFVAILPISRQASIAGSQRERDKVQLATPTQMTTNNVARAENLVDRAHAMNERANHELPLTEAELDGIILSIRNVYPDDGQLDFDELRAFLGEVAHLSHKNWTRTGMNSEVLAKILIPQGISSNARQLLARIVQEGNWDGAARHAASNIADDLPWAVLVTGVNGIRKTTSMYQPWFTALLTEALVAPAGRPAVFDTSVLPSGQTAFFRQLDHMIATICNEEFSVLYKLTGLAMNEGQDPPRDLVRKYSDLKASIFSRYRTLSELLGVALLREAQKLKSNCMMETSGRDVAMFTYVDEFFSEGYNKLALHFIINDLSCAQESVDSRMIGEMKIGVEAVAANDTLQVIYSNAGGPYGSEVLPGVQEASDRVWNEVVLKNDGVGEDWFKATIAINAHPTKPWTAQAVRPDGTLGCIHVFEASSS